MESPHHETAQPRRALDERVGFDRRRFIDVIALLALLGTPAVLVLVAVADRPYLLIGLALTIPALTAAPIALEHRHGRLIHRRHQRTPELRVVTRSRW